MARESPRQMCCRSALSVCFGALSVVVVYLALQRVGAARAHLYKNAHVLLASSSPVNAANASALGERHAVSSASAARVEQSSVAGAARGLLCSKRVVVSVLHAWRAEHESSAPNVDTVGRVHVVAMNDTVVFAPEDIISGRAAALVRAFQKACGSDRLRLFATYGDDAWAKARRRLASQAVATDAFHVVFEYSRDVLRADRVFYDRNVRTLDASRGGGYWLWKPWLANATIALLRDGDELMYLDSGCFLQRSPQPWFDDIAPERSVVPWRGLQIVGQPVRMWTKGDIFVAVGVNATETLLDSMQLLGGIWVMRVERITRRIAAEWAAFAQTGDLITDEPSVAPNPRGFMENRHDQAIFTIIMYKYGGAMFVDDTFPADVAIKENRIVVAARSRD